MLDRIEITKSLIPYKFDILLGDEIFTITVNYNASADMFTLSLEKNGEMICLGEPIIYGVPLWQDSYVCGKYPELEIIPIDESGDMNSVTFDYLNRTVYLSINNTGDANG